MQPADDPRLSAFPAELRGLLDAELAAGNAVVEIASCFPAPPAGAYVLLARPVTTRVPQSGEGLRYYDRNMPQYSGEWTDERRFYFVLEPAHPDREHPPTRRVAGPAEAGAPASRPAQVQPAREQTPSRPAEPERAPPSRVRSLVDRFQASMQIDYEKWHDGIGYEVSLISAASAGERAQIEALLLPRAEQDWRDVEALSVIGSDTARAALRRAFKHGDAAIRAAVLRCAPELVDEEKKIGHLVRALRDARFYGGLSEAIRVAADFHPAEVMKEIFLGALLREGEVAGHFAALLWHIHGRSPAIFDWAQRPFFLRFRPDDPQQRKAAFRDLCGQIDVDPTPYLKTRRPFRFATPEGASGAR